VDQFFTTIENQRRSQAPLGAAQMEASYDVFVNVQGGGPTGQADAVRLGLARAIKRLHPDQDPILREEGLLTRDSRMKERKHYGRRGARRGFQFSKR
jgi:small subunit ribosomal protein S9